MFKTLEAWHYLRHFTEKNPLEIHQFPMKFRGHCASAASDAQLRGCSPGTAPAPAMTAQSRPVDSVVFLGHRTIDYRSFMWLKNNGICLPCLPFL